MLCGIRSEKELYWSPLKMAPLFSLASSILHIRFPFFLGLQGPLPPHRAPLSTATGKQAPIPVARAPKFVGNGANWGDGGRGEDSEGGRVEAREVSCREGCGGGRVEALVGVWAAGHGARHGEGHVGEWGERRVERQGSREILGWGQGGSAGGRELGSRGMGRPVQSGGREWDASKAREGSPVRRNTDRCTPLLPASGCRQSRTFVPHWDFTGALTQAGDNWRVSQSVSWGSWGSWFGWPSLRLYIKVSQTELRPPCMAPEPHSL